MVQHETTEELIHVSTGTLFKILLYLSSYIMHWKIKLYHIKNNKTFADSTNKINKIINAEGKNQDVIGKCRNYFPKCFLNLFFKHSDMIPFSIMAKLKLPLVHSFSFG